MGAGALAVIHPKALVDADVVIGIGTQIWQFASIIRGARVGAGCNVASCAIVDGAIVGDLCLIGQGTQVHPGTRIGQRVFVGPGVICCNDQWPSVSKDGFDVAGLHERPTIIIDDGAVIGAGAIILPGFRVAAGAMVAAGVVCDRDVPAGTLLRRDGSLGRIPDDGGASRRMRWAS
jgi:UDP-2-acetamido-3-amino-2,3-dideoxy-glucuronate N-acetyltransferase